MRVHGGSLDELFENAARGLISILGAGADRPDDEQGISVAAPDVEALLVRFLDELIYLIDSRGIRIASVAAHVEGARAEATLGCTASGGPPDGTELKGATYHQLSVRGRGPGHHATVFFDV